MRIKKTNLTRRLLLVCLILSVQCKSRGPQENEERSKYEEITNFIQSTVDEFNIPGIAISITSDDEIVYHQAFGVRNIETQDSLKSEHSFHFASVSKPFVATATMQLVEQHKISLDDKLITHIPYFKIDDKRYKDITIRQILNHTSGLGDVDDYEWDNPQYDAGAAENFVKSLANEKLKFSPGTNWSYSNTAFDIMADVIAKVSGMPFETFVKENIFQPLEMKNSSFIYPEIPENLRTTPHIWYGTRKVSDVYPYNRKHAPSSTLNTSVLEMGHWAIAHLNKGKYKNSRILNEESFNELWTNSVDIENKPKIGLSWFLGEHKGTRKIYHSGGDTGYRSFFVMLPDSNMAVTIASNYQYTPMDLLADRVLDVLLGFEPAPIKQHISIPFVEIYMRDGLKAATDFFEAMRADTLKRYNFDERGFYYFGYYFDDVGLTKEAIPLFKHNTELFPNSVDAHNGLGRMLMKTNQLKEARKSFEKALELDPGNKEATEKLAETKSLIER